MDLAKEIREEKGFGYYEMSKQMRMSYSAYQALEERSKNIHLSHLVRLFQISEWSVSKFWNRVCVEYGKEKL